VTDLAPARDVTAAAPGSGAAAATLGSQPARRLLDAAVAHALPIVAHDLRNGLGIVGVQVEAMQLRAFGARVDEVAARGHGDAAAHAVEQLAAQLDALGAFARADEGDLAQLAGEMAALFPLRHVVVEGGAAPCPVPALAVPLLRAAALELLLLALDAAGPWRIAVRRDAGASVLVVAAGRPLALPVGAEWLVQVEGAGARVVSVEGALVLTCPSA
jgi:signal transduction histidine kinase